MAKSSDKNYVFNVNSIEMGSGTAVEIETGAEIDVESGGQLKLAGTAITSNAAELNSLDGVATTWQTDVLTAPTYTIGSEGGNVINVLCSLNDISSTAIAESKSVLMYLSDSATGDGVTATAPDGDIAIGTDGTILFEHTADKIFQMWTETDGDFDVDIGEAAAGTWYMCVVVAGNLFVSAAITFS